MPSGPDLGRACSELHLDAEVSLNRHCRKVPVAAEGEVGTVRVAFVEQVDGTGKDFGTLAQAQPATPVDNRVAGILVGVGGIDEVLADVVDLEFRVPGVVRLIAPAGAAQPARRRIDQVAVFDNLAAAGAPREVVLVHGIGARQAEDVAGGAHSAANSTPWDRVLPSLTLNPLASRKM